MGNRIVFGDIIFEDSQIVAGNANIQHSLNGESLSIDTLNFVIFSGNEITNFIDANGEYFICLGGDQLQTVSSVKYDIEDFDMTDPLNLYIDNAHIGKFYATDIKQISANQYEFPCESTVGQLDESMHYGGMYTGETLDVVLDDILGTVPHLYDESVTELKIYGWLPYDTKRNNIIQLTIATGIAVKTLSTGHLYFTALAVDTVSTFGHNRATLGGKVIDLKPYSAVVVTEHTYIETTEEVTLFDDTSNSTEKIIFRDPVHDLSIANGTIVESGANYAIINCSGNAKLIGKKYLHITKEVTEGVSTDRPVHVKDITVINVLNSVDVAERLYNLYSTARAIEQDVLFSSERPGDTVDVVNPYTLDFESGVIQKMDIQLSNKNKAKSRFLIDFVPMPPSSGYANRIVLTGSGNWSVPYGVDRCRAIMIGGGTGGQGGLNGGDGTPIQYDPWSGGNKFYGSNGGDGGLGGLGGLPGKILNITVDLTGQSQITYACGAGGDGGASNGGLGSDGTATTFATYTSSDGAIPERAYVDIFTGNSYAVSGSSGFSGALGGNGAYNGTGANGSDSDTGTGGLGGNGHYASSKGFAGGGGGGGAAHNADGNNATNAYYENTDKYRIYGGNGGSGGSPTAPSAQVSGNGGNGGNGGGGGGGAGGAWWADNQSTYRASPGSVGAGGDGSIGGKGGDGLIIIYY